MSEYIIYTKEKGKIETDHFNVFSDLDDLTLHREDGPAYQHFHENGKLEQIEYCIDGKRHRLDGPAVQKFHLSGRLYFEAYYKHGSFHREDGPALIEFKLNGDLDTEEFWLNGQQVAFKLWKDRVKAKTIEVDSIADLEKQAKKEKGYYIDGTDHYISTNSKRPIVYTIKESNVFESFTDFYKNINES